MIRLLLPLVAFYMAIATATRPKRRGRPAKPLWPAWVGHWPRLTGRQEPEHESSFEGDGEDGDRACRLGVRIARTRSLPWQWLTLRKIMSRRPDGLWTHPDVCLICPRQNGKTWIILLRILFGLFVLNERIVYSAQRGATADAAFKRVKEIVERRPSLMRRVVTMSGGHQGTGYIELRSGARCRFGVRSGDLGRGFDRIDLVCFDEAYNLDEAEVASLTGAQLASPNAQTIYTSTPVVASQHPNCRVFAGIRRRGRRREKDLLYLEFAAPDPVDDEDRARRRDDAETWRLASPSYGVIQKERDIIRNRKLATTFSGLELFDADYCGWGDWPADELDREHPIKPEEWADLEERPILVGDYVIAVDREPRGKHRWAIAAGRRTEDGRVFGEVGFFRTAKLGEVAAYLLLLVEKWDPAAVIVDAKSPASGLAPYVKELGIEMVVTGTNQIALACRGIVDAVEGSDVAHSGQPVMTTAVDVVSKRLLPRGDFAWDTTEGNIAPLVAFTLAYWGVLEYGSELQPAAAPGLVSLEEGDVHDLDVLGAGF